MIAALLMIVAVAAFYAGMGALWRRVEQPVPISMPDPAELERLVSERVEDILTRGFRLGYLYASTGGCEQS